jgi:hypothetical protein
VAAVTAFAANPVLHTLEVLEPTVNHQLRKVCRSLEGLLGRPLVPSGALPWGFGYGPAAEAVLARFVAGLSALRCAACWRATRLGQERISFELRVQFLGTLTESQ